MKRLPILPTLVVLIAVGIMIRLGFWQLDRLHQKEAMLARYAASQSLSSAVPWPAPGRQDEVLYRHSSVSCASVRGISSVSGQNDRGQAGYAHIADCTLADGGRAHVVLGWSPAPTPPAWSGGDAIGWIAPGPRLVAHPPLAGLAPNAKPDPRDIPNNHLAYAVQWFLFAAVALVIYAIALRKRLRP
jgi:cytochrome oxidase assembly protein ShyY1